MKRVLFGAALFAALSISTTAFVAASNTAMAAPASTTSDADQKALKSKCTADAKAQSLKGDDKKKFMTDCLAGKSPTTVAAAPAAAAPVAASTSDQQSLMKTCNADAKKQDLKGDARKAFMKTCLSGKPATTATIAAPVTTATATTAVAPPATSATVDNGKTEQQSLMKTCNAQAKTQDLKGDARKAFMSSCLSGKPAVVAAPAALYRSDGDDWPRNIQPTVR